MEKQKYQIKFEKFSNWKKINFVVIFTFFIVVLILIQLFNGAVIQMAPHSLNRAPWIRNKFSLLWLNGSNIDLKDDKLNLKYLHFPPNGKIITLTRAFPKGGIYTEKKTTKIVSVTTNGSLPRCPVKPPNLHGPVTVYKDSPPFSQIEKLYPNLLPGGRFKPPDCISRHRVAILVPYRNRENNLKTFLKNLHGFLQRQQLDYGIYIIEQAKGSKFNRGLLLNIGFTEVLKIYGYQCFVFHDVDKLPLDDRNMYSCPNQPRHLAAAIDTLRYMLPYGYFFGGVSVLTKDQYKTVNGFSNKYFGWGGEDDDLYYRIVNKGYKVTRYSMKIARYTSSGHGPDKGNEVNPQRFNLLGQRHRRFDTDGLNSMKYKVLERSFNKLYTRIYVEINQTDFSGVK